MRVSTSPLAVALLLTLALTTACSAFERSGIVVRPRVDQSDPDIRTAIPTELGAETDTATVGTLSPVRGTMVRRVCRTAGWSRDWIATAYENASGECPLAAGTDSTAYAPIIVRVDTQPVGATLDVCADQITPRGWERVPLDGTDGSLRCPGAARDGASAIRRIRRVI